MKTTEISWRVWKSGVCHTTKFIFYPSWSSKWNPKLEELKSFLKAGWLLMVSWTICPTKLQRNQLMLEIEFWRERGPPPFLLLLVKPSQTLVWALSLDGNLICKFRWWTEKTFSFFFWWVFLMKQFPRRRPFHFAHWLLRVMSG